MTKEEIWTKAQKCAAADKIDDDCSEYVNFAFWLLENEIESDDIFILAGLSESDISFRYDARHYFALVCDALKIEIDGSKTDYFYACYLLDCVKSGKVSAFDAVFDLANLYFQEDKQIFKDWLDFSYQLEDALDDECVLVDPSLSLTKENAQSYIVRRFELWKIFFDLELPKDFKKQAYCKKCGLRVFPKTVERGFFRKSLHTICPKCKAEDFAWCCDNSGMEIYLKEIGYKFLDSEN